MCFIQTRTDWSSCGSAWLTAAVNIRSVGFDFCLGLDFLSLLLDIPLKMSSLSQREWGAHLQEFFILFARHKEGRMDGRKEGRKEGKSYVDFICNDSEESLHRCLNALFQEFPQELLRRESIK